MVSIRNTSPRQLFAGLLVLELIAMALFIALAGDITVFPSSDPVKLLNARLGFAAAALIALTIVPLVVLLRNESKTPWDTSASIGLAFLIAYMTVNSVIYTVQAVAVPRFFLSHPELAQQLWFGDSGRLAFSIDLFGYMLNGIGVMMLGLPLTRDERWLRWVGWMLVISGISSVACYFTHAIGVDWAASILTTVAGALFLPIALISLRK